MKKVIVLFTVLAFHATLVFAQNVKKLDEKNGFKELILGSSYEDLKKYLAEIPTEADNKEEVAVYEVVDSSFFEVGESDINKIFTRFFKGRLESVTIETKGVANSKEFLNALTMAYGKGEKRNTYIEEYHWDGRKTAMYYKLTPSAKSAKVIVSSKELTASSDKHKKDVKKNVVKEL